PCPPPRPHRSGPVLDRHRLCQHPVVLGARGGRVRGVVAVTAVKSLYCDRCGDKLLIWGAPTIKVLRAAARERGWVSRRSDGMTVDFCAACLDRLDRLDPARATALRARTEGPSLTAPGYGGE